MRPAQIKTILVALLQTPMVICGYICTAVESSGGIPATNKYNNSAFKVTGQMKMHSHYLPEYPVNSGLYSGNRCQ